MIYFVIIMIITIVIIIEKPWVWSRSDETAKSGKGRFLLGAWRTSWDYHRDQNFDQNDDHLNDDHHNDDHLNDDDHNDDHLNDDHQNDDGNIRDDE